jgi:hypothetical protein
VSCDYLSAAGRKGAGAEEVEMALADKGARSGWLMVTALVAVACGSASELDDYATGLPGIVPNPVAPPASVGEACDAKRGCEEEDGCKQSTAIGVVPVTFPGGYCTAACTTNDDCPDGTGCVTSAGQCMDLCAGAVECRTAEGYTCQNLPLQSTGPKYCLPAIDVGGLGGSGTGGLLGGLFGDAGLGGLFGGGLFGGTGAADAGSLIIPYAEPGASFGGSAD